MVGKSLFIVLVCLIVACLGIPNGPWKLKYSFAGESSDYNKDRGKSRIQSAFTVNTQDETNGFPGAYSKASPGNGNLFIDQQGYLVLQPTCPTHLVNGQCRAYQCGDKTVNGDVCQCNNETIKNGWFPWWCQDQWGSAKIISNQVFNIHAKGGLFVFDDVWIPRGKPLWPAIWLLPVSNPVYGGTGTPKGGNWASWPQNGELDILETVGIDPRIFGTIHYTCGNDYSGWPGIDVTVNGNAKKGSAYQITPLTGNILATRSGGNNPLPSDGHLGSLAFMWFVDANNGPTFVWFIAGNNPVGPDGKFSFTDQLDVMINREGTNSISGVSGDGSGSLSFGTTPYWPGSLVNTPPLTLYKGWDGQNAYGYQGYYKVQGNVKTASVGIHTGQVSSRNPNGLGIVPQFDSSGKAINGTIAELYEPYLCSMMGDWGTDFVPLPWKPVECQNPTPGAPKSACPRTGKGPANSYDYCMVEGANRPGVGWWSNSPMAAGVAYAPFDPNQNWNIMLNVAIGGSWPRGAGQEGVPPGQNFINMATTNLRMKSINYYEIN